MPKKSLPPFDKHVYYEKSVQDPSFDLEFLNDTYKEIRGRKPLSLREDFCGTGFLSCEWVKQGRKHSAVGIDLCAETMYNGAQRHMAALTPHQQRRVEYVQKNVLKATNIHADVVVAHNFSYWIFKQRKELLKYFRAVRKSMLAKSIFVMDIMGGPEAVEIETEEKRLRGFQYQWECKDFNPITHECQFAIHIKRNGERIRKDVFTYDWRLWSMPELIDILTDAGFSEVKSYWEGEDGRGGGDGEFDECSDAPNDSVWVSYLVALP